MRGDFKRRRKLSSKIKLWFRRLTFRDVYGCIKFILSYAIEFMMCALIFGLLFLVPALFH